MKVAIVAPFPLLIEIFSKYLKTFMMILKVMNKHVKHGEMPIFFGIIIKRRTRGNEFSWLGLKSPQSSSRFRDQHIYITIFVMLINSVCCEKYLKKDTKKRVNFNAKDTKKSDIQKGENYLRFAYDTSLQASLVALYQNIEQGVLGSNYICVAFVKALIYNVFFYMFT
ncbi:hypothetical protein ACJX0J_011189 [Zea mays]